MDAEPTHESVIEVTQSDERLLDAAEIETLSKSLTRNTARQHIDILVERLRRDAAALKRAEKSRDMVTDSTKKGPESMDVDTTSSALSIPPESPIPKSPPTITVCSDELNKFMPISNFAFDTGKYNSQYVTLYIDLPGVGSIPRDQISCNFTSESVDLVVNQLNGKNYRLFRNNLDKEIDDERCKYIVKKEKIVIKLAKKKGEYGSYDHWSDLTSKKKSSAKKSASSDPSAGIMDMMKEMYDSGDDNMKKMIGETMMKQRNGELDKGMNDDYGADL